MAIESDAWPFRQVIEKAEAEYGGKFLSQSPAVREPVLQQRRIAGDRRPTHTPRTIMGQARTNRRRRRQAKSNFAHLAGHKERPEYKKMDAATSARRLAKLIESENTRRMRTKK